MENKLIVLHLSDLHFEKKGIQDIKKVFRGLLSDLRGRCAEGLKPDLIIFSGDLIKIGDNGYSDSLSEYEEVKKVFIEPVLAEVGCSQDNLIICAGNHDIQRSKINSIYETGIKTSLKDRESVNRYIDESLNNADSLAFARLLNFERFFTSFGNTNLISHNIFYSIYKYHLFGKKIGVASINSAWRAFGGEDDYGRLIIGDRIVNMCIDSLEDCEIKIGVVHHPFHWLVEFEREQLPRFVYDSFHFWITGHIHESEFKLVQVVNDNQVVLLSGGALYESRQYFNGYSITELDLRNGSGNIYFREYNDRGGFFGPASYLSFDKGIYNFSLNLSKIKSGNRQIQLVSQLRDQVIRSSNQSLLPLSQNNRLSGKTLLDLFVTPPLYNEAESVLKSSRKENDWISIDINEILNSGKNYLIIGKKESGKSSLLSYLFLAGLDLKERSQLKLSAILDYANLPTGKNRIDKAISAFFIENQIKADATSLMSQPNWSLFIDNFSIKNDKNYDALKYFIEEHPNWQYVFAMDEDLLEELRDHETESLGVTLERVYIHSFRRKEIRHLVEKWFSNNPLSLDTGEVTDLIIRRIREANLQKSPLMVTMLLIAIEHSGEDYRPINKASLMENIVEILLDKVAIYDFFKGSIDFKNIIDFLSALSKYMVINEATVLTESELGSFLSDYFSRRGLLISGGYKKLYNYLFEKGILLGNESHISFRFQGFYEYFIAKQIISMDKVFYDYVVHEDNYLGFTSSLDYLTGLQRNNEEIVQLLASRAEQDLIALENLYGVEISLDDFDDFAIADYDLEHTKKPEQDFDQKKNELIKTLEASKFSEDQKDQLYDKSERSLNNHESTEEAGREETGFETERHKLEAKALGSTILYAVVLRNCESSELGFKNYHFRNCLEIYLKLSYIITTTFSKLLIAKLTDEKIQDLVQSSNVDIKGKANLEKVPKETLKIFAESLLNEFLFFLLNTIVVGELSTPKLETTVSQQLERTDNHVLLQLTTLMLAIDLRIQDYIEKIDIYRKDICKNTFTFDILLNKLRVHYSFTQLSQKDNGRLAEIIADLTITRTHLPKIFKSKIINGLVSKKRDNGV